MERERSGKVIAIATLIVGIIGLSLGFAAFSTSLHITSDADVKVDASAWKVGFSDQSSSIHAGSVNGSGTNGTLAITQFVISQGTKAQLSTTNGSSVTYSFYVVNEGDMDAYLNSVTMGNLSCAYPTTNTPAPTTTDNGYTTVTAGSGTITDGDCRAMFEATLVLDGDANATFKNGDPAVSSGFGNTAKLTRPTYSNSTKTPTYIPATLTIAYKNDALQSVGTVPNGDFVVSLSDSVVVYGTASN